MEDEVVVALKQKHLTKALGSDSFHAIFSQKYWPIVRQEVVGMVLGFLNGEVDISGINKIYFSYSEGQISNSDL